MPTFRQSSVAFLTRLYPFKSGCATLANSRLIQRLAGTSPERVWSAVPGGNVLASLDDFVGRAAYFVGELDPKITWICSQMVKPGDTVLDIGANIGMVTLSLSKMVGSCGTVHAFEPNPDIHKILEATFERNQISNVRLHRTALGAESGQLELRIPKGNAGSASLIRRKSLTDCNVHVVPVRPLAEIVVEEQIKSIRLIKIDVEGFEAEVFLGAREVLNAVRPEAIIFELNEKPVGSVSQQPVFKILSSAGYQFFSIPKSLFRPRLQRFIPDEATNLVGHDFLAVPSELYEKVAKVVRADM